MRLIEHYLSIQGEGLHAGKLTYFVRFARCNLRCVWCDSAFTFGKGKAVDFETVKKAIVESGAKFVCLTGGEPLLHEADCLRLMKSLPHHHFDIETGGSLDIRQVRRKNSSVIMDWKLEHSGMRQKMKEKNLFLLRPDYDLLKFVTDFSEAERTEIESVAAQTEKIGFPISVQPVYPIKKTKSFSSKDFARIAEWMITLKNPRLQFNLQIHKHIWGLHRRGI